MDKGRGGDRVRSSSIIVNRIHVSLLGLEYAAIFMHWHELFRHLVKWKLKAAVLL